MMPKGYKSKHGYATAQKSGGLGFREISDIMTRSGDRMNHGTARNVLHRAMAKIAESVCKLQGVSDTDLRSEVSRIAADPRFQDAIRDLLIEKT